MRQTQTWQQGAKRVSTRQQAWKMLTREQDAPGRQWASGFAGKAEIAPCLSYCEYLSHSSLPCVASPVSGVNPVQSLHLFSHCINYIPPVCLTVWRPASLCFPAVSSFKCLVKGSFLFKTCFLISCCCLNASVFQTLQYIAHNI